MTSPWCLFWYALPPRWARRSTKLGTSCNNHRKLLKVNFVCFCLTCLDAENFTNTGLQSPQKDDCKLYLSIWYLYHYFVIFTHI